MTDVGLIPSDWEVKELNNLSDKIMVGIASSATHAYRDKGVVMFRNQNIKPNRLDDSDILYITPEYEAIFKNKRLKTGDLLTARTGYPGTTCKVPSTYEGSQSFTTLITRVNDGLVESEYLCFYLNSEQGQKFFEQNQIGGGQKNVNAGTLKLLPVPLPPTLAEQTAIATALSDADGLITSLEKLIAKKRNIKQGAMQELLRPKEGWVVKRLGEIGEVIIGLTYKPENVSNDGVLVLRSSNIQYDQLEFIDNVYVNINVSEKLRLKENDILICVRNGSRDLIGKCALITSKVKGESFGAFMSVFRSPLNRYVIHVFRSDIVKKQIEEYLGATINQITNKSLNSFEIPFPPPNEQLAIATILSDMDTELTTLEKKLEKAKQLKQGMMQQLLTGKIRLV